MTTEPTDIAVSEEQEKTQIAEIAKASILNIEANKKAYEELRDEYKGIVLPEFKDPEFKKVYKKITEGSGKLVKARTAADKLVKTEIAIVDEVKLKIKAAGEDLKAITAETEKEIKSLKETAETLIEDAKQEEIRQQEEKKQIRINSLYELGFKYKVGYYQLAELTIQDLQVVQYSEAQFEGFISQAKAVFESLEQERIAQEAAEKKAQEDADAKAEQERAEALKEQERLQAEATAKQKELDEAKAKQAEQDKIIAELQAKLKAAEVVLKPKVGDIIGSQQIVSITPLDPSVSPDAVFNTFSDLKDHLEAPAKNGTPVKFTPEERDVLTEEVEQLMAEEITDEYFSFDVKLNFTLSYPYIDTKVGKATLRVYVEQFLDAAQEGLTPADVSASGAIGDQLLFLVIKPKA